MNLSKLLTLLVEEKTNDGTFKSQKIIAEESGVNPSFLSRSMNGKTKCVEDLDNIFNTLTKDLTEDQFLQALKLIQSFSIKK